jgi:hypothetical protein
MTTGVSGRPDVTAVVASLGGETAGIPRHGAVMVGVISAARV